MRVAPRTLLCGSSWRAGSIVNTGFDELRQLASAADDKVSLAIGMSGQVTMLLIHGRYREASQLASEFIGLMESIGDPALTLALLYGAMAAKRFTGEVAEVLRLAQLCIDLADGEVPTRATSSWDHRWRRAHSCAAPRDAAWGCPDGKPTSSGQFGGSARVRPRDARLR